MTPMVSAGDSVLCTVAERVEQLPQVTEIGRLGGDEFALLLPGELNGLHEGFP